MRRRDIPRSLLALTLGGALRSAASARESTSTPRGCAPHFPLTADEIAAGITPADDAYAPGNVLRYGADPTGRLDATAAFQRAHDAGNAMTVPAGRFLLNGTTLDTAFVISKSNFSMTGVGPQSQLISTETRLAEIVTGLAVVNVFCTPDTREDIANVYLANFRISGPVSNTGEIANNRNYRNGLQIFGPRHPHNIKDVRVDGVIVEGMQMACFAVNGYTAPDKTYYTLVRGKFTNCTARYGREDGYNCFACANDLTFTNCEAHDLDGFGHEHGTGQLTIEGGTIRRCGQAGIGTEYNVTIGAGKHTVIRGVTISDITSAAYPRQPAFSLGQAVSPFNTEISDCNISRCGGNGITVYGRPTQIAISGNRIIDVGGGGASAFGIETYSGTGISILDNTISTQTPGYSMASGITCIGTPTASMVISGNDIQGSTKQKIDVGKPAQVRRNLPAALDYVPRSTAVPGESVLMSLTVGAGTLEAADMCVRIRAWGTTAANRHTKTVTLAFGPVSVIGSGAMVQGGPWVIEALLIVEAPGARGAMRFSASGQADGAVIRATSARSAGFDFDADQILAIVARGLEAGDVTQEGMLVEFPT
jgi:hypothetical protein